MAMYLLTAVDSDKTPHRWIEVRDARSNRILGKFQSVEQATDFVLKRGEFAAMKPGERIINGVREDHRWKRSETTAPYGFSDNPRRTDARGRPLPPVVDTQFLEPVDRPGGPRDRPETVTPADTPDPRTTGRQNGAQP